MGNWNVTKNIKQKYSTVYLSNSNTQGSPQSSLNKLSQKTGTIEINSFTRENFWDNISPAYSTYWTLASILSKRRLLKGSEMTYFPVIHVFCSVSHKANHSQYFFLLQYHVCPIKNSHTLKDNTLFVHYILRFK